MGKKRLPGAGGSSVSLDPAVRSVFASRDGRKLLVGTRGGELYEMSTADGSDAAAVGTGGASGRGSGRGPLTAGHGRGHVNDYVVLTLALYGPRAVRFPRSQSLDNGSGRQHDLVANEQRCVIF